PGCDQSVLKGGGGQKHIEAKCCCFFPSTGFQINGSVLQAIVNRYADAQYAIDFDSFVSCLIKLEMLFKMFKALDRDGSGKIELNMQQETCMLSGKLPLWLQIN
uniref:EF-hand domain-containing protein n=1 Tax=Oryzias latipes TaxID=8090 RepID=A0A3P9MDQ0_ORYLA